MTFTSGESADGGLDELVEFRLSLASKSVIRFSKQAMTDRMAAWASGGTVFQRDSGIEGWGLIQQILRAYGTKGSIP